MSNVDYKIQPTKIINPIDTSKWPLLLKNYGDLNIRTGHYTPLACGCSPMNRKLNDYLEAGVINLDKPPNPSSHEVVSWIKNILRVDKTGHSGTLDPKVTGCLLVCLNRATRLVKSQQGVGKEYVGIIKFHQKPKSLEAIKSAFNNFKGSLFQRPPVIAAVKRQLRIRTVYDLELLDYDEEEMIALFRCDCQAGTYIRTLCVHIGLYLGVGAHMLELRRTRSGNFDENRNLVTMHDIMDAKAFYDLYRDERYLRRVIMPQEILCVGLPRIVVKDSAVNAITYGAKLMIPGVLRFENGIDIDSEIIMMTTKGEAIALGISKMSTSTISSVDHGVVAVIKRVLMVRDLYNVRWGYGHRASFKKALISKGMLEKDGKPNAKTPEAWFKSEGYFPQLMASISQPDLTNQNNSIKNEVKDEGLSTKEEITENSSQKRVKNEIFDEDLQNYEKKSKKSKKSSKA